jgi:pimeloyl-ACP methyl ester carboxylesterase
MGTIVGAMRHRGQNVRELWHDQENAACPRFLLGHSMGGLAALDQANRCATAGHPVRAVVTIDPTGKPGTLYCPKRTRCLNYYDPTHLIGFGARAVVGATNVRMSGFSHLQLPSVPRVVNGALAATR